MIAYLIVNFGGPRNVGEIAPFLTSLLQDRDVIRTPLPTFLHNPLFGYIAKKRSIHAEKEYEKMGGGSPIYQTTEDIASFLALKLKAQVLTFHRYLPDTHHSFVEQIESCTATEIRVFPLFPQFCYATTGSIARFFDQHLSKQTVNKLRWIRSYPDHPGFIQSFVQTMKDHLEKENLKEENVAFLFSAHGIPQSFLKDPRETYQTECNLSFEACKKHFPKAVSWLAYQSKFGPGKWLQPYTKEMSEQPLSWAQNRSHVVVVPIAFTSDHIETLVEIEDQYLPPIRQAGLNASRCPALNCEAAWLSAIPAILDQSLFHSNHALIR